MDRDDDFILQKRVRAAQQRLEQRLHEAQSQAAKLLPLVQLTRRVQGLEGREVEPVYHKIIIFVSIKP